MLMYQLAPDDIIITSVFCPHWSGITTTQDELSVQTNYYFHPQSVLHVHIMECDDYDTYICPCLFDERIFSLALLRMNDVFVSDDQNLNE